MISSSLAGAHACSPVLTPVAQQLAPGALSICVVMLSWCVCTSSSSEPWHHLCVNTSASPYLQLMSANVFAVAANFPNSAQTDTSMWRYCILKSSVLFYVTVFMADHCHASRQQSLPFKLEGDKVPSITSAGCLLCCCWWLSLKMVAGFCDIVPELQ